MSADIGLFEAMNTQRAIRYLKPDPVPEEMISKLIEA
ncbi:MAG: nitroreductase, partial [Chloroflexi bacterium]|nr:nitroreductase [Chloroflexota bacterium]